jgi:hypothetical protein
MKLFDNIFLVCHSRTRNLIKKFGAFFTVLCGAHYTTGNTA